MRFGVSMKAICIRKGDKNFDRRMMHIWWKHRCIVRGVFRRYGATTARCLRELLQTEKEPIDCSICKTDIEHVHKSELKKIKDKLDAAGIETRSVLWNVKDKIDYELGKLGR